MDARGQRGSETRAACRIGEHDERGTRRTGHGFLQRAVLAPRGQADVKDAHVGLLAQDRIRRGVKPGHAADHVMTRPAEQ